MGVLQAKKESVKEHCKRINAKLERSISMQAEWAVPDAALKADMMDQIVTDVLIPYNNFWTSFSELQLLQNPQKHFKYDSLLPCHASIGLVQVCCMEHSLCGCETFGVNM